MFGLFSSMFTLCKLEKLQEMSLFRAVLFPTPEQHTSCFLTVFQFTFSGHGVCVFFDCYPSSTPSLLSCALFYSVLDVPCHCVLELPLVSFSCVAASHLVIKVTPAKAVTNCVTNKQLMDF